MNKFWNFVDNSENNSEGVRELFIKGPIAEESWYGDEVTPELFRNELNASKGPLTVWIHSPGGDCFAAAQIYNMLKEYDGFVGVVIDGLAASAATVIAMAGDVIEMSPVAMMMIHNPATMVVGDHKDMKKAIDILNEVKESIINAYEIKTGLDRKTISRLMDQETWMDCHKAIELGFADRLHKCENNSGKTALFEDFKACCSFSAKQYSTCFLNKLVPQAQTAHTRVKAQDLINRLELLIKKER